jgi:hypothetical protein
MCQKGAKEELYMGHNQSYAWEFKLQMIQLLEKNAQNPSQINWDHHVTRSLLYVGRAALSGARGSSLCAHPGRSRAHQRLIGRRMRKIRLLTWSGCVDNRRLNEGLLRLEVGVLKNA